MTAAPSTGLVYMVASADREQTLPPSLHEKLRPNRPHTGKAMTPPGAGQSVVLYVHISESNPSLEVALRAAALEVPLVCVAVVEDGLLPSAHDALLPPSCPIDRAATFWLEALRELQARAVGSRQQSVRLSLPRPGYQLGNSRCAMSLPPCRPTDRSATLWSAQGGCALHMSQAYFARRGTALYVCTWKRKAAVLR